MMNDLIELLQRDINELETQKLELESELNKLDKLIQGFTGDDFFDIPSNDLKFVLNKGEELQLVRTERTFIETFANNNGTLNVIREIGLDDTQKEIILSIKRKLQSLKVRSEDSNESIILNSKLNRAKNLVLVLRNTDINLIDDFDYIKYLFNKNNVPLEKQKEFILEINKSNLNFHSNMIGNASTPSDEVEVIDVDTLDKTDLNVDEVIEVFNKYGINFNDLPKQYRDRLLKYGDINKFDELLGLLKQKGLTFVYKKYEILTKILLYSNSDIIEEAVRLSYGLDNFLIKTPTVLFPELRERNVRWERTGGTGAYNESGSFNKFKANIEFFNSVGIDPLYISRKCITLLTRSPKVIKRAYAGLKLYGISITDDVSAISVLWARNPLDELDIAIECDALEYIMDNLSRLADNNRVNLYRIKYNDKLLNEGSENASKTPYLSSRNTKKLKLTEKFYKSGVDVYGDTSDDTFEKYEAVQPLIENQKKYDDFLSNITADSISKSTIESPIIRSLDEQFKRSEYVYNINGVIISRLKVIRYYEKLMYDFDLTPDLLLYIVTKNTMLDSSELNRVTGALYFARVRGSSL